MSSWRQRNQPGSRKNKTTTTISRHVVALQQPRCFIPLLSSLVTRFSNSKLIHRVRFCCQEYASVCVCVSARADIFILYIYDTWRKNDDFSIYLSAINSDLFETRFVVQ